MTEGGSYSTYHLDKNLREIARRELEEEPETRQVYIKMFQMWLPKQLHLVKKPTEAMLVKFMRSTQFNLKTTIDMLENYYTMRNRLPEWFKSFDWLRLPSLSIFTDGWFIPLGYNSRTGERVLFMRFGMYDEKEFSVNDYFQAFFMTIEYMLQEEKTQICGLIIVCDMPSECFEPSKLFKVDENMAKKFLHVLQFALPIRIKRWYYLDSPVFGHFLVQILHLCISPEMASKIISIGSDLHQLHQVVDKELLPMEYGGTTALKSLASQFLSKLLTCQHIIKDLELYITDETQSTFKQITNEKLFGAFEPQPW